MKILGTSAFYHDSAATLVINGRIVAAAQEERFTRKKQDARFPMRAIRYRIDVLARVISS
jgi:carbamoyltransferase